MSPRARRPVAFSLRRLVGPHRPTPGPALSPIGDLIEELVRRWAAGERPRVEGYLDRVDDDGALDLIYKEFWIREALDEAPDPAEYLARFPHLADRLQTLLAFHRVAALAQADDRSPIPPRPLQAGDSLGPYRLIRELGRGQFATVFLAAQTDMEDRHVVVKVSRRPSLEPRLLAKAQHRHVVEVLAAGKTLDNQFHWVSMPFLGGATLADILAEWRARKVRPTTGRELLDLLDAVAAPEYPPLHLSRAARELIGGGSHSQAIAWMVARLAEALNHAFRLGITHEDVKPSNILVTADGDPMLLDFSLGLGLDPRSTDNPDPGECGSLHYMAPERLRMFAEGRGGRSPKPLDNHRGDIYALGLVLAESISGRPPMGSLDPSELPWKLAEDLADDRESESAVGRRLREVPLGLRPILARCLAPNPNDRYRAAIHLAEDLDRWRNDRPLIHCASRSPILPAIRWARKRRAALTAAALFVSAGLIASAVVLRIRDGTAVQAAWAKAGRIWERSDLFGLRYTLPGRWTPVEPDDPVVLARRRLDEYDVLGPVDWRARDDVRALNEPDRQDLEAWIQEQALRFARGLKDRDGARPDRVRALNTLEKVAAGGASGPILRQIQALRADLDLPTEPARPVPASPTWIGAYLRGVETEIDRPRESLRYYNQALAMNPRSGWARLRLALVQIRLGEYQEATRNLEQCLERYPNSASLRLEMATCLLLQGRYDEALEQDNRAVELDPDLAMAYHNRLFIRASLGQSAENRADLQRFEAIAGFHHGLLGRGLRDELAEAATRATSASATAAITPPIDQPPAALPGYIEQGLLASPDDVGLLMKAGTRHRLAREFARARSRMDRVLEVEPTNLQALYHRGMSRLEMGDSGGLADLQRIRNDPRLEELLARQPEAVDIFLILAHAEALNENSDQAIAVGMQGILLAEKVDQDRTRGRLHFIVAESWVQEHHRGKPEALTLAAHHLGLALQLVPALKSTYQTETLFDAVRPTLNEQLGIDDDSP